MTSIRRRWSDRCRHGAGSDARCLLLMVLDAAEVEEVLQEAGALEALAPYAVAIPVEAAGALGLDLPVGRAARSSFRKAAVLAP